MYAARELPDAHFVLAKVYLMRGAVELGESEMERYRQAITNNGKSASTLTR